MTKEQVINAVVDQIESMDMVVSKVATNRYYRIGIIRGMLTAFNMAGFITSIEADNIEDELYEMMVGEY